MFHDKRQYSPPSVFALTPQILILASTLMYFFPYFVGGFDYIDIDGRKFRFIYHEEAGYAVALAFISIVAAIFIFRPVRQEFGGTTHSNMDESLILILMIIVFGSITILTPGIFSSSKVDVLESTGRIQYVFYNCCIIGFVFGMLAGWTKHKLLILLSSAGLILTLYIGHRSALAISILSFAYIRYRNKSLLGVRKRYLIGSVLAFAFLAVYKSVYSAMKSGNYDLVNQRIQFDQLSTSALVGLEQFVTFSHLDFVVTYDYTLPCSNLWLVAFSFIPFSDSVFGSASCGFNEQVQPIFFPGYRGGVAANIWAEFYANFGYAGLPLLVVLLSLICLGIEAIIRNVQSAALKAGLIVSIIHLTFYIQRKELLGAFVSAKRAIFVALFIFGIVYIHRKCFPRVRVPATRSLGAGTTQRYMAEE